MDKQLGRKIIYGLSVLAFCGVILYAVRFDRTPKLSPGERGNANAALLAQLAETELSEEMMEEMSAEESAEEVADRSEGYENIAVEIAGPGGKQEVLLFRQQDQAYFFLPSFADSDALVWKFDEGEYVLALNGEAVHNGDRIPDSSGQQPGTITYVQNGKEPQTCSLTFLQSDTLPAVFIGTDSGSMAYLNEDKTHEEVGSFACILADGTLDSAGRLGKVSGRGYSSFNAPKKSYGIRFAAETDVLGMGSAKKWVLQANAYDLSRMRNRVVYDLAREMGVPYAVDCAYADVYFNGEYAGNYLICERVEVAKERVDIKDGYLLEGVFESRVDEEKEYSTFVGSDAGWYEIKYPENISDEKLNEVQVYMDEVAHLIERSGSWEDYDRLKEMVDMESFIRMFLLDELTNEADLNRASTFYVIADDGRLYAGPVWDYDRSFGNVKSSAYELLDCFTVGLGEQLFKSPYFRKDAAESYNEYYRELMAQYGSSYIDTQQAELKTSIRMDTVRWSDASVNKYTIFNDMYDTFDDGVAYLKTSFGIRYQLIDDIFNEPGKYHQVEFVNTSVIAEYVSQRLWVRDGEEIPKEVMDYLAGRYECDMWLMEDGREYQTEPVIGDLRLLSGKTGEEP